jgi:hypothetical protein
LLAEEYENIFPRLVEISALNPEVLHDRGRLMFEEQAEHSVNALLRATDNIAPYFITSFCIHEEGSYQYSNGLLSQWRSYARGGFAIEFDEHEIDVLCRQEGERWRYQGIITDTVVYEDHESRVRPEQFKGMAGAFLRELFMSSRPELNEILGTKSVEDFARPFLATAPFLKDIGFKEEAEYRIVAMCTRASRRDEGDERNTKPIQFRTRPDGKVSPYIALYEEISSNPLPIKSIIIGPHVQQENQKMAVELLLEKNNINAEVRLSETPFRE